MSNIQLLIYHTQKACLVKYMSGKLTLTGDHGNSFWPFALNKSNIGPVMNFWTNALANVSLNRFLKSSKLALPVIIASTSANLKTLVDKGKFNKEFYKALNKSSIHIPPLKKRTSEIIPLATQFIKRFNQKYGKNIKKIDADVRHYLESYDWPGNVSELKNVIEHVVIISQGENISMRLKLALRDRRKIPNIPSSVSARPCNIPRAIST